MISAMIRFVGTAIGGAFLCGVLLVWYESVKPGGYEKKNEGTIIWVSIAGGIMIALTVFGIGHFPFP